MIFQKSIATVCGIGYMGRGAGTAASVVCCTVILLIPGAHNLWWQLTAIIFVLIAGIWSAGAVESIWGHDSNKIVIDEVAGMMVTLLFIPADIKYAAAGFLLFRFFDIAKPLWIKKAEQLPAGWGVMADDLLAGLYAQLILRIIIAAKLF